MSKQGQKGLPESVSDLQEMVGKLHQKLENVEHKLEGAERENNRLHELLRLMRAQKYSQRSERFGMEMENIQRLLFADMEAAKAKSADATEKEPEEIVVPEHTRKKPGRKPLPEDLPRVDVVHDIPEAEKQCACGSIMSRIGEETAELLQIKPAQLWVERHIRPKYACKSCEGVESEDKTVKIAPVPAHMIPKSFASPSLLAHVIIGKFCDALPFYRQEQQFKRYGIELPRATMCNWALKVAERLKPLLEMLRLEVLASQLVNVDETIVQVLDEPDRSPQSKSYIWAFRGGGMGPPALYYQYAPSRSGEVARQFLAGYKGYVQSDGYNGYDFIDNEKDMIHVGCWAHARRKFHEVIQASGEKFRGDGKAKKALKMIQDLYLIDREAKNRGFDEEQRCQLRQEKAKPVLDEFADWLQALAPKVPPTSLLGKAISYTIGQWPRLIKYLDDGMLFLDNNVIENSIRPFVIGRKNWLFSQSPEGAQASAAFYSLIETAKANGLDPYRYFLYLFEKYPHAQTMEDVHNLLPMSDLKIEIGSPNQKIDLDIPINSAI